MTDQSAQPLPPQPPTILDQLKMKLLADGVEAVGAVAVVLLLVFIFVRTGCHGVGTVLGPAAVTSTAPRVEVGRDKVKVYPGQVPGSKGPTPVPTELPKAPDDTVDVVTNPDGTTTVRVNRFAFVTEPTLGVLWNGKLGLFEHPDDAFEPVAGLRMVKFSNLGLGPMITPRRVGVQLDLRVGNLTAAGAASIPFGDLALTFGASLNVVPFD